MLNEDDSIILQYEFVWRRGLVDVLPDAGLKFLLALEQVVRSRRSLSVGFRCAPACGGVMYFRRKTSAGRAYLQIVESRREGDQVR